eukprot:m.30053 g.30053  ORF g.30053 m.30053 type:complete len:383 (-) comp8168_c0_seq1:92-1240(-)
MRSFPAAALMVATGFMLNQVTKMTTSKPQIIAATSMSTLLMMVIGVNIVRNALLVPLQLLPAILVGMIDDRTKYWENSNNDDSGLKFSRVQIPVPEEDVILDGAHLHNNAASGDRIIVWLNANGVIYEQNMEFIRKYALKLKAHAVIFNFRGVGDSSGWPCVANDLVKDSHAVLAFVRKQFNVTDRNILLHGHSLGAGVVSMIAEDCECAVVHDRSFWKMSVEAVELMRLTGLSNLMGGILGGYLFFLCSLNMAVAGFEHYGFGSSVLFGSMGGFFLFGKSGFVLLIAADLIKYMGWEMELKGNWSFDRGLIIYHRRDAMIPYTVSSFHRNVHPSVPSGASFELVRDWNPQMNHMAPLSTDVAAWEQIIQLVDVLLTRVART